MSFTPKHTFEDVEYHLIVYIALISSNVFQNLRIGDIEHDEADYFDKYDGLYLNNQYAKDSRRKDEHTMIAGIMGVKRESIAKAADECYARFEKPFYDVRGLAKLMFDTIIKIENGERL